MQWSFPANRELPLSPPPQIQNENEAINNRSRWVDFDQVLSIDWLYENFPISNDAPLARRINVSLSNAKLSDTYTIKEGQEVIDGMLVSYQMDYIELEVGSKRTKAVLSTGLSFEEINARWHDKSEEPKGLELAAEKYELSADGHIVVHGHLEDIFLSKDQYHAPYWVTLTQ